MRWSLLLLLCSLLPCIAEEKSAGTVFKLWPGVAPGEKGNIPEEKFEPAKPNEKPPLLRLGNVSVPTITITKPKPEKDTKTAVIIAPGGGYTILAWEHEGTQVAEWLNDLGVTAILLKYRVPRRPDTPKNVSPLPALQDAQRAIGLVRSKAKELGIEPDRIGMLGFSAGGHLTAWASTNTEKRAYEPVDDADKVSCRPDFAVLIYPGGILDAEKKIKPEINITKEMPPSFLAVAFDDEGSFDSTVELMRAMKAQKVPAELHVYSAGGHGFGMKNIGKPAQTWPARVEDWMKQSGYLKK